MWICGCTKRGEKCFQIGHKLLCIGEKVTPIIQSNRTEKKTVKARSLCYIIGLYSISSFMRTNEVNTKMYI